MMHNFSEPMPFGTVAATDEREWWLEFDTAGTPHTWTGKAPSEALAELRARADLAHSQPLFNRITARLVACIER